jgi:GrpB-like predicted nucleotidyltransferase (UPF0157 family)
MPRLGLRFDEVKLEEYRNEWLENFCDEKELIEGLKLNYKVYVEHVGSTAVPGMCAKPIIDILVGVKRYSDYKQLIKPFSKIGYVFHREPRRYQALFLKESLDGKTTHHLKVVRYKGKSWRDYIKFRDELRSSKKLFNAYRKLKILLSKKFSQDRKLYTSGKQLIIKQSLQELK